MERRPDAPTRRALALGLPWIPILGSLLSARAPGFQSGGTPPPASPPSGAPPSGAPPQAGRKRLLATAILLRHAEKDASGDSMNPGLSVEGKERAQALARLLARARVTHLFASKYRRAQETLQPFAEASGLKINTDSGAIAAELGPHVLSLAAGSVAVIVGHSNTIPALAVALGGEIAGLEPSAQGPVISEKDFGRVFILTPAPEGTEKTLVLEIAYGA